MSEVAVAEEMIGFDGVDIFFHPTPFKSVDPNPILGKYGIHSGRYLKTYRGFENKLKTAYEEGDLEAWKNIMLANATKDFFFFCYFVLDLPVNNPFLLARCNEITLEESPRTFHLWGREHWKSTLLTFAYPIWRVIKNPDIRIGIFSFTRDISRTFLVPIMQAMSGNQKLNILWPELFSENERKFPAFSRLDGVLVNRKLKAKNKTIECWGLTDKMPTSSHFDLMIFDDIVTVDSVRSKYQVDKVVDAFRHSDNLSSEGGEKVVLGTRYHERDPYYFIMTEDDWKMYVYPSEIIELEEPDDLYGLMYKGEEEGIPVMYSKETLAKKRRSQSSEIYAAQHLQRPTSRSTAAFSRLWLKYYDKAPKGLNKCILVDPSKGQSSGADYTTIYVLGIDAFRCYFICEMVRDRLSLGERWAVIRDLSRKHGTRKIFYEEQAMQDDMTYFNEKQSMEGISLDIITISQSKNKERRIKNLEVFFKSGRFVFPRVAAYKNREGEVVDLMTSFIEEEYVNYPHGVHHDDMLDALTFISHHKFELAAPNRGEKVEEDVKPVFDPLNRSARKTYKPRSWLYR